MPKAGAATDGVGDGGIGATFRDCRMFLVTAGLINSRNWFNKCRLLDVLASMRRCGLNLGPAQRIEAPQGAVKRTLSTKVAVRVLVAEPLSFSLLSSLSSSLSSSDWSCGSSTT